MRAPSTAKSARQPRAQDKHAAARDALARGAWAEARAHLEEIIAQGETAEAHEDLALATWWLDDAAATFASRERAYALYRDAGEPRSAARVATWLVWDYLAFRGDFAVASGWLERARRLLAEHQDSAEYGWLLIREGDVALFRGHDPHAAIDSARRAGVIGRALKDGGIEFTALALEGLARVSNGDVADGMKCLDEATVAATAGDVPELHAVALVCCWQIFACERVRDFDRAVQWIDRAKEFSKRWGLSPFSAVCKTQYGGVLIWRGDWEEAEQELTSATREMERVRPGMTQQPIARLGELRLRQGRLEDAERLFDQSASQPISRLGRAALLLERGDAAQALLVLRQFAEDIGPTEATARAGALELLVRSHTALQDLEHAERATAELDAIATALGTAPLMASLASARGVLRRADGDDVSAAMYFAKAADLYERGGAPFETARAWMERAACLLRVGSDANRADAERDMRCARDTFRSLGATREAERAQQMLEQVGRRGGGEVAGAQVGTSPRKGAKLTARHVEILRLVAQGQSNAQIAKRLKLSEHTVKRHIANLLTKLGLASRSAAVAHAAREGLL